MRTWLRSSIGSGRPRRRRGAASSLAFTSRSVSSSRTAAGSGQRASWGAAASSVSPYLLLRRSREGGGAYQGPWPRGVARRGGLRQARSGRHGWPAGVLAEQVCASSAMPGPSISARPLCAEHDVLVPGVLAGDHVHSPAPLVLCPIPLGSAQDHPRHTTSHETSLLRVLCWRTGRVRVRGSPWR